MRKSKLRRGFTFVELMVVIVILSMLVAFAAPKMFKKLGKAKHELAKSKMALVSKGLEEFYIDCGRYPSDDEGLGALIEAPQELGEKWQGQYCKSSELLDPWGNQYMYEAEGSINLGSYDLISYGADGQEGGEGENADIYNE